MAEPLTRERGYADGLADRPSEPEYTMRDGLPHHREGYTEYRTGYLEGMRAREAMEGRTQRPGERRQPEGRSQRSGAREVAREVARVAWAESQWYTALLAAGFLVIYGVGRVWAVLGTVGFWFYVVVVAVDVVYVAILVLLPGILVLALSLRSRVVDWSEQAWLWLATLCRVFHAVVGVFLVTVLKHVSSQWS
jgi:hypothetical protein